MAAKKEAINFENDERGLAVGEKDLKTLAHLCAMQVGLESRIAELNIEMTRLSEELRGVSEQDIPTLMEELGVGAFALHDGTEIEIDSNIAATITQANKTKAYAWLDKHKHGDLIKNVATISFNREDKEKADKFLIWAKKKKLAISNKQSIHAGTLKAFVREELRKEAEGELKKKDYIPRELFSVFEYKKAKVILPN